MSDLHPNSDKKGLTPFRRAVLRGLGVLLPPLLTILFLLWIGNSVHRYIVQPVEWAANSIIVSRIAKIYDRLPETAVVDRNNPGISTISGQRFIKMESGQWVPKKVYDRVRRNPGPVLPSTAESLYDRYVAIEYLKPIFSVPAFLLLLLIVVYLAGRFMAARLGHMLWSQFELMVNRLPFIRTIYGTVKQVTDIVFNEREIEFTRVVAVEYPRKGIWSVGFVTGESMLAIRDAAGEPVLSVLVPTSPMPATGFTISVRKSEAVELLLSVDQAFQFIVSCGVVVPDPNGKGVKPSQIAQHIENALPAPAADYVDP